jgi:hypothetical protein
MNIKIKINTLLSKYTYSQNKVLAGCTQTNSKTIKLAGKFSTQFENIEFNIIKKTSNNSEEREHYEIISVITTPPLSHVAKQMFNSSTIFKNFLNCQEHGKTNLKKALDLGLSQAYLNSIIFYSK